MKAKFPPFTSNAASSIDYLEGFTTCLPVGTPPTDRRQCYETGPSTHDPVTKPKHYQRGGIETIDYIRATLGDEGFIAYAIGNSLKYLSRFRDKDGVQDLKKARVYLDWAIESMEKTP